MNKKIAIISSVLVLMCFVGAVCFILPRSMDEVSVLQKRQMSLEDLFNENGNFYVYFNREDCPYCDNVSEDIAKLANNYKVYYIDSELLKNTKQYDWEMHEKTYDVEIGEKKSNGEISYYDGLNENDIEEKYPPKYYKIVWANTRYAEMHEGKEEGKVYAIYTHPVLTESDLEKDNFILPAVPVLVEFSNHKVVGYYFDDKEIIDFLDSNEKPLDRYWNLD